MIFEKPIVFHRRGAPLVGRFLRTTESVLERKPAVLVMRSWLTVKEQMATTYGRRLAELGYYGRTDRGAVPAWRNEMAEMTWLYWLAFDGLAAADAVGRDSSRVRAKDLPQAPHPRHAKPCARCNTRRLRDKHLG